MKQLIKISVLFSISFLFIHLNLSAQTDFRKGYVLTNSKDTIKGFVLYSGGSLYSKCEFKTSLDAKATKYLPGEIESYRFEEGKFFITKRLSPKDSISYFLEYLIKGKLNVYYMRDNTDRYFVEKENGRMVELSEVERELLSDKFVRYIPAKKFKGKLTSILAECTSIHPAIQKLELSHKSLINLAKVYHETVCEGEKCIVFERKTKKLDFNFGIHTGVSFNSFNFGGMLVSSYKPNLIFGIHTELNGFVAWDERIGICLGLSYLQMTSKKLTAISSIQVKWKDKLYQFSLPPFTGSNDLSELESDLNITFLKVPIYLNYTLNYNKLKPYAGFGLANSFVLKQDESFKVTSFVVEYGKSIPFYQIGYIAKMGLKYVLPNKSNLFFETSLEQYSSLNLNEILRFYATSLTFSVGYSF